MFDKFRIVTSFTDLPIAERSGNRVTYRNFLWLSEHGFVAVQEATFEVPSLEHIKLESHRTEDGALVMDVSMPAPKLVNVKFG